MSHLKRAGGLACVVGLLLLTALRVSPIHALSALVDPAFDIGPAPNGTVTAIALQQPDKVIVVGGFGRIGNTDRYRIARLNHDGTVDATFNAVVGDTITTVAVDANNRVLIGGVFSLVNGQTRNGLARLTPDGVLDTAFQTTTLSQGGMVIDIAVTPDQKILVGGYFTSINGTSRTMVARLNSDGSIDDSFNPPPLDGTVSKVSRDTSGRVVIGGHFGTVGGRSQRALARLTETGALDTGFAPILGDSVGAFGVEADGSVVTLRSFATSVNGELTAPIARFLGTNGSQDPTFLQTAGVSGGSQPTIFAVAVQSNGQLLLGGNFTRVNGAASAGLARLNADGTLDPAFPIGSGVTGGSAQVNALALDIPRARALVAGDFTTVDGEVRNRVARLITGQPVPPPGRTTRVDVPINGTHTCDSFAGRPSISGDGRYVVFDSTAANLVGGDTNGWSIRDVFVRDRQTNQTRRLSVSNTGAEANGSSTNAVISVNGRFVAFESDATNLVPGDTNNLRDIFLVDRTSGKIVRVSLRNGGVQAIGGPSTDPSISADGAYVAFASEATNLVFGDTNRASDIFVHHRLSHTTVRVNLSGSGAQTETYFSSTTPHVSSTGRYVVFSSGASNLVAGITSASPWQIYMRDRQTAKTTLVSVSDDGRVGNEFSDAASVSASGRFVAFRSHARNFVADQNAWPDVFLRDVTVRRTTRVSISSSRVEGTQYSGWPVMTADGKWIAFYSMAPNLVEGDTNNESDVFIRDMVQGLTTRVSLTAADGQANSMSSHPAISADGRYVAFFSTATNLVPQDTNPCGGIFVRDRGTP